MHFTKQFASSINRSDYLHLLPQWNKDTAIDAQLYNDTIQTDYPCFPPREGPQNDNRYPTIIYLETAYINLHYETYYTFIHHICSCAIEKDPYWRINNKVTIPHFYVGPEVMLTRGFERILQEYNTTTCGPIFVGAPNEDPHLTIVTTSYPNDFEPGHVRGYHKLINNPKYIFICHEDAPPSLEENATNVFFLTPHHSRYIIPSFFPPTLVQRHSKSIRQQHPEKPPIFLVLGGFNNKYRRNVNSLVYPLKALRHKNFTVRFLGGSSNSASNKGLTEMLRNKFPEDDYQKIELLPRLDTDEFMVRVSEADVILPLVESSNFYHEKGY
ncbi:hypothetical protein ACHAXR_002903, partial [Thalassiosira sp. AJA248-18]